MDETMILRTLPQMMQASVKSIEEITKIFLEIAAQHRDNVLVEKLLSHGKLGGGLDFEICRSFAAHDFDEKLTQYGIPHAIIYDKVTGTTSIITRDIDREAVLSAKNELFVEQKRLSRLSPEEFMRLNKGKSVEIIRARTAVEAKIFQQTAKKYGLSNIALQRNSLDTQKIDILYAQKDKEKALAIMSKAAIATVGLSGERTTARISREIEYQSNLMQDVQSMEKEFYVVSQANPKEYLHFSKDGFQYYKNGVLTREESRSGSRFVSASKTHISGIVSPITLTKEEFETTPEKREQIIKERRIFTDRSAIAKKRAEIEQNARQLIDRKLISDEKNATVIPREFYSLEASFEKVFNNESAINNETRLLIEKLDALSLTEKSMLKNYIGRELSARESFLHSCEAENADFYVVNKRNSQEYIHISQNGLSLYRNGEQITECMREDASYKEILTERTREFKNPVILTKEEFNSSKEELTQAIRSKKTPLEIQENNIEELERAARLLIEKKLSIDNGEQVQIPSSFYNPNVSFHEFVEIEQINDEETKELIDTIDKLEDKEKILIKSYIKDAFSKVESIEVQSAYVDPALKEDEFEPSFRSFETEIDIPRMDEQDFIMDEEISIDSDSE